MMIRLIILIFIFCGSYSFADSITINQQLLQETQASINIFYRTILNFDKVQIKVIAVGTGQAITNAINCDGNILIVHDKEKRRRIHEQWLRIK